MTLFEYCKRVYITYGDNFLSVNGRLVSPWWSTLSYEDKQRANREEYMFYNRNRKCRNFTEKFFKELEQDV